MMSEQQGLTVIVKTVTRAILAVIFLYGFYIILHGHLSPGGGFGGGVVLALGFLSVLLAYGRPAAQKWLNIRVLHSVESSGPLLLLALGLLGMAAGGVFLLNTLGKGRLFDLWSAGFILPLNIIIGVKVGLSLFLAVWALTEWDPEKGDDA
jgi:multicomponent Na+:H+ antiporter subunit B